MSFQKQMSRADEISKLKKIAQNKEEQRVLSKET